MMASPNLIGIGSGLVAAVLFASLANNTLLAILLFYLTPMPVLLAGIGWGARAALLSTITAVLLLGLVQSFQTAIGFALYIGLPGLLLSYLFLLHRIVQPDEAAAGDAASGQAAVEWYPLGRIVAWAALIAGGLTSLGMLLMGGDSDSYRNAVRALFDEEAMKQLQAVLGPDFGPAEMERFVERFTRFILPIFAAGFWLIVMIGNMWLAAKSAAISGLLARPAFNLIRVEYPPFLLAGFFAAVGLGLTSGMLGLISTAFAGAIGTAFLILGLAVIHVSLARSPIKLLVLFGLYFGLFLTPWLAPVIMIIGLAEPFLQLRERQWRRMSSTANGAGPHF
ncbi:MAG: hypothetical protein HC850_08640 [Rhodomicrobium sp.]|nr:hypothetical protein [Rhodomicrobium sp.]